MTAQETLADLLTVLDQADDDLVIYASRGPRFGPDSEAFLAYPPEDGSVPLASARLQYLLEVELAKDAIRVWREWRANREPTPEEMCEAVIFYAEHDAFLPVDPGKKP